LIESLLELSRVTSRARVLEPVDLNQVLADVLSDLEVRMQQSGGHVKAGPLPTVMADRLQMHQLFQNLIGNALKFHKENVAPIIRIRTERSAKAWEIHVEDNGIGSRSSISIEFSVLSSACIRKTCAKEAGWAWQSATRLSATTSGRSPRTASPEPAATSSWFYRQRR